MGVPIRFILLLCLLLIAGCGKAQKSTDELISDLKSGKAQDRIAAARFLRDRKGDAVTIVPVLIESLKDKESDVRLSAAAKLGDFGEEAKSAIPQLQVTVKDKDARVRRVAGNALTRIDPTLAPHTDPLKSPAK